MTVQLRQFDAAAVSINFLPDLTAADGEVLLSRSYVCTTDENGLGTINLPVRSSGSIRYKFFIVNPAGGVSTGQFYLEAGSTVDLADLIAGAAPATDTLKDYVDMKIQELRNEIFLD